MMMSLFTAYPALPECQALPCASGCVRLPLAPAAQAPHADSLRWLALRTRVRYIALPLQHPQPNKPGSAARSAVGVGRASQLWPRARWWACQGNYLGGHSACLQVQQILPPLQWLSGGKERASPATWCHEVPCSIVSFGFTLIVNKIGRGTR